jgi:hypothetical protein
MGKENAAISGVNSSSLSVVFPKKSECSRHERARNVPRGDNNANANNNNNNNNMKRASAHGPSAHARSRPERARKLVILHVLTYLLTLLTYLLSYLPYPGR